jgi:tRNA(fMet)-specific endonuclease VapC
VTYLFDTDHISFLQRMAGPEYAVLSLRLASHTPDEFAFSTISFYEQSFGANSFMSRAHTTAEVVRGYALFSDILRSYSPVTALPFDAPAAAVFDYLRSLSPRVATMDLRLAVIALSQKLISLMRNTRDFGRVPGLLIEDWTV